MSKQVLLSNGNPKLAKSINEWYYTIGLHLAPALQSGQTTQFLRLIVQLRLVLNELHLQLVAV